MRSETEIAYLAGILDGEGCITLVRNQGPAGYEDRTYYRLVVNVTNTDAGLLDWIAQRWPDCRLGVVNVGKAAERAKDCLRLTWTGPRALGLLSQVRPYLVAKAGQADIAVRFRATGDYRGRPVPQHVNDERAALVDEIRALNRKGR
ncbi:MAG: hypothetical protein ACOYY2_13045 [Actinomycetota bacterium]